MNQPTPDNQLDALFALARAHRPDTAAAEYAFETRLLARLRDARSIDSVWAKVSWRLIPFFAACAVILALWQAQVISDFNTAAALASTQNPGIADTSNFLD